MRAGEAAKKIAEELSAISDCPAFEARCLLKHYLSLDTSDIYCNCDIGQADFSLVEAAVQQRLKHIPLQYILGKWEYMGFEFLLDEHVLIPRPETELLCECLLNKINANSVVYDLCSGSGCIALSLAMLSGARVFAFEKYSGAINILKKNILLHNCSLVSAVECDITERPCFELPEADVIVSNPPYICQKDMLSLQPEVLHEPHTALSGGEDGLVFYRAIAENFTDCLRKGGYAAFEIGEGQAPDVIRIFSSLMHLQTICDYNGIERVLLFRKDY